MFIIRKKTKTKRGKNRKKTNVFLFALKKRFKKILKIVFYLIPITIIIFFIYKRDYFGRLVGLVEFTYLKTVEKSICNNIIIETINYADKNKINNDIKYFCDSIENETFFYSLNDLKNSILEDPWIKRVTIKKQLPYTLIIAIEEYKPFAIYKDKNNFLLIDQYGDVINISNSEKRAFFNLLIIAGNNSREYVSSLFNLLSITPQIFSKVKIANRIGNRRWNLTLDNGILIKLPEDNKGLIKAWRKLEKTLEMKGVEIGLKTIDLRIPDRTFLEYDEYNFEDIKKKTK